MTGAERQSSPRRRVAVRLSRQEAILVAIYRTASERHQREMIAVAGRAYIGSDSTRQGAFFAEADTLNCHRIRVDEMAPLITLGDELHGLCWHSWPASERAKWKHRKAAPS